MSLITEVRANIGGRTDLDTQIGTALDDAAEELSDMEWTELASRDDTGSATADDVEVDLPDDCEELLRVQVLDDTSSYEIELVSQDEAERRFPEADERPMAKPVVGYRLGSTLYLAPMPDDNYTLRFTYRAVLTVTSGAASVGGFDPLLVAYATAQVFEGIERARESADRWWRIFERRVERKRRSQKGASGTRRLDTRLPPASPYTDPYTLTWK